MTQRTYQLRYKWPHLTTKLNFISTSYHIIKLFFPVTELPSKPVVFDEYGNEISGTAGPYHEGGEFKLVCSVKGGEYNFITLNGHHNISLVLDPPIKDCKDYVDENVSIFKL